MGDCYVQTRLLDKNKKELPVLAIVFYILFAIFFFIHSMHSSMFFQERLTEYHELFLRIYDLSTNALIALSIITIFTGSDSNKISLKALTIVVIVISFLYNHFRDITTNRTIMVYLLLVVCSQKKSLKTICRIFLIIGWGWVIASFIGYKLGLITDITLGDRHAFGSIYCTDLACHFLTLTMALCVLRNGKLRIYEYLSIVLLMGINVLYLKAKVGLICMFLVLAVTFYHQYIAPHAKQRNNKTLKWICITSFAVLAVITLVMTLGYTTDPNRFLNKYPFLGTFKSRFYMGRVAFDQYKLNLWGNYIAERGNGGKVGGQTENYFFLDISYIKIPLINGIVIFSLLMFFFTALQVRLYKFKGNALYLMVLVSIFLLDCAVEHHILELAYDFFPFMLFCNLDIYGSKQLSYQHIRDVDVVNTDRMVMCTSSDVN